MKIMTFSQRQGLKPVKEVIQLDSIDNAIRNGLWNGLTLYFWDLVSQYGSTQLSNRVDVAWLVKKLWANYFKLTLDTLDDHWPTTLKYIKNYFYKCEWNEVYDIVEFVAQNFDREDAKRGFVDSCNIILEREMSGYRFINGEIAPFTSAEEISEIEEALGQSAPNEPVSIHLAAALDSLSDRNAPEYRNSIKESISAVEAMCIHISGEPKASLVQALKKIEGKSGVPLHGALREPSKSSMVTPAMLMAYVMP